MAWPTLTNVNPLPFGTPTLNRLRNEQIETYASLVALRDAIGPDWATSIGASTNLAEFAQSVLDTIGGLDSTYATDAEVDAAIAAIDIPNDLSDLGPPTADVDWAGFGITSLRDPLAPQEPATRHYVDAFLTGLSVKPAVNYATTGNLNATYAGGVLTEVGNGALSVDSGSPTAGQRVLVRLQTNPAHNGIYDVTNAGSGGTQYVLTRSADMDAGSEVPGAFCFVLGAAPQTLAGYGFVVVGPGPFTIGTTPIPWTQFTGPATTLTAGTGLGIAGNVISITDNELLALAGTTAAANKLPYFNGTSTMTTADFTSVGRDLLAGVSTAAVRTVLGLGSAAVEDVGYATGKLPQLVKGVVNGSISDAVAIANGVAIQAAADAAEAAGGGYPLLPAGTIEVMPVSGTAPPILCGDGVKLRGQGIESTILVLRQGSNADSVIGTKQWSGNVTVTGTAQRDWGVSHMTVDYNWHDKAGATVRNTSTNHGHCIAGGMYHARIEYVRMWRAYGNSLHVDDVTSDGTHDDGSGSDMLQNVVRKCISEYCGLTAYKFDHNTASANAGGPVDGWFEDNIAVSPNQRNVDDTTGNNDREGHGAYFHEASGWVISGNHIYGQYTTSGSSFSGFSGNKCKTAIYARNANGTTIFGNQCADWGYATAAANMDMAGIRLAILGTSAAVYGRRPSVVFGNKVFTDEDAASTKCYGIRVSAATGNEGHFSICGNGIESRAAEAQPHLGQTPLLTGIYFSTGGTGVLYGTVSGNELVACAKQVDFSAGTDLTQIVFRGNSFPAPVWPEVVDSTIPTGTSPAATWQNMPRIGVDADLALVTTGKLLCVQAFLQRGQKVTGVAFTSGGTAAGVPTHHWAALYDNVGALIAATTDKTTTAWAANAVTRYTFSASQTITRTGLYYLAIMVAATTMPTLAGAPCRAAISTLPPILCGTDETHTGLAGAGTAPATLAALTPAAGVPYIYVT